LAILKHVVDFHHHRKGCGTGMGATQQPPKLVNFGFAINHVFSGSGNRDQITDKLQGFIRGVADFVAVVCIHCSSISLKYHRFKADSKGEYDAFL
jgi:hypothetical protein